MLQSPLHLTALETSFSASAPLLSICHHHHHCHCHLDHRHGVHPNSHKHFIPYMGFCASIWDSVRHHCHHHHHHHDHQKWRCERTALEQILIRTPLPSLNKVDSWPEHLHNILVDCTSLKYIAVLGKKVPETPNLCYIFEILMTHSFQIWW